jgi:hypothetical protein
MHKDSVILFLRDAEVFTIERFVEWVEDWPVWVLLLAIVIEFGEYEEARASFLVVFVVVEFVCYESFAISCV